MLAPWEPPLRCTIEDYEAALKTHEEVYRGLDPADLIIYTDGSGYQG